MKSQELSPATVISIVSLVLTFLNTLLVVAAATRTFYWNEQAKQKNRREKRLEKKQDLVKKVLDGYLALRRRRSITYVMRKVIRTKDEQEHSISMFNDLRKYPLKPDNHPEDVICDLNDAMNQLGDLIMNMVRLIEEYSEFCDSDGQFKELRNIGIKSFFSDLYLFYVNYVLHVCKLNVYPSVNSQEFKRSIHMLGLPKEQKTDSFHIYLIYGTKKVIEHLHIQEEIQGKIESFIKGPDSSHSSSGQT